MVTEKQVAALKYLIAASKYGNDTAKSIFFFLLDKSERLSKQVYVTFTQGLEGYTGGEIDKAARSISGMHSCNCTTHIDQIMIAMGTAHRFSVHYGHFDHDGKYDTSGMFPGLPQDMVSDPKLTVLDAPCRYTFWLAPGSYSKSAERLTTTRQELETIDLSRPGLYPDIENQRLAG
jgi:hypothetical protein